MPITRGMMTSVTPEWATPQAFFDRANERYGTFTLDTAATLDNAKCAAFYTKDDDGLTKPWTGRVWCNPPYGRAISRWVARGHQAARERESALVAMLVPARTDTRWWHAHVMEATVVHLVKGRLRFSNADPAPFPSALVIWIPGQLGDPNFIGGL